MKSIDKIKEDYHLFLEIQIGKYLKSTNKSDFTNESEIANVIDKIIDIYNKKVASEHLRLDNLNEKAKIEWFNSIEIDFNEPIEDKGEYEDAISDDILEEINEHIDEIFSFLPPGSFNILIFAGPALEAIGMPLERFNKLISGEPPLDIEEDIISWAFYLTENVLFSLLEKNQTKSRKFLKNAVDIALDELNEEQTTDVIYQIQNSIIKELGLKIKKENNKKKKK